MVIIDIEVYKNYFLLSALHIPTGKIKHFESLDDSPIDEQAIKTLMRRNTTVSFNGLAYDLPLLSYKLNGASNKQVKAASDKVIKSKMPSWRTFKDLRIDTPKTWDHIDLIEVAPGQSSLKIYGGRLGCERLQDLPIDPSETISAAQADLLREYCENDLHTTLALYKALEQQVALRVSMSDQYGMDLRSKSDAQIAEMIIKSELKRFTGKDHWRPELADDYTFRYQDPQIISFKTEQMQTIFARLLETDFGLGANGAVQMPDWLKDTRIKIGGTEYQMGIGGLHSCEKSRAIFRREGEVLADFDVASYYPSIILQQKLAPQSMGVPFLRVYQSIVNRRLEAKRVGDKVTADTLKICVNGSFGKLGSKWSALYAPDLLIQTTVTGQLALLMLIESLELAGVSVVSANTDGVVTYGKVEQEALIEEVCFDWMMNTSYELERTDYRALVSRDVNTYVAVKTDGTYKGKGAFASGGLMKNPDFPIIYRAVAEHVTTGVDVETIIRGCADIKEFVSLRKVTGGASWRGEVLGKAVRFYYSTSVASDECIHYTKNSNRVAKSAGGKPVMQLPNSLPGDIDYDAYVTMAEKLRCEVGL